MDELECHCADCSDNIDYGYCECNAVHDENEIGGYCASCGGAVVEEGS